MASSPLVLVLGMHRSGTSLLGGVLQHLGLALPGDVIAADKHNPAGYFEWDQIVEIQENLLIDLERWWPSEQGCLPLPSAWLLHPAPMAARGLSAHTGPSTSTADDRLHAKPEADAAARRRCQSSPRSAQITFVSLFTSSIAAFRSLTGMG